MAKSKIYDATLRLVDKFSKPLQQVEKHLDNFERHYKATGESLWATGKSLEGLGKNMTKYVTAPIIAVGTGAVASFKEVDESMDTIIKKTGASGKAVKEFEKTFKKVGGDLPVDLKKVGDAIGEVNTQFSLSGKGLEKTSEQFLKFSEINEQDVSQAAIQAKQALEAYNLGVEDLDNVLDSVTATAQATGQGTDKLFETVIKGAPQIKDLNLSFSEATALLGNLEQSGVDSTKALSYMSRAQVEFAKNGKNLGQGLGDLQKQLDGAKNHTDKLNIASKIFGTKGATLMVDAIERGTLNFNEFADASEKASGSVSRTFDETIDPIDKFKQMFNKLKFVGNDLFKASEGIWSPLMDKAIGKVEKLTNWFNNLSDEQKQNIVKWAGIIAVAGPSILGIGKMFQFVGNKYKDLAKFAGGVKKAGGILKWATSPAHLLVLKFLLIIAVVVLLIKYWDKIKAKAEQIFPGIGDKISGLVERAKDLLKVLVDWGSEKLSHFLDFWSKTWEELSPFVDIAIKTIGGVLNGLIKILSGILDFIIGVFTGDWEKAWNGVKEIFSGIWEAIKSIAKGVINGITKTINGMLGGLNKLKVPDWVPGLGGKGINIPLIPQLAKGTDFWEGGLVEINERGGEIVDLPRGSRVIPHDKSVSEAYKMGKGEEVKQTSLTISIPKLADQIVVREDADIDRITNALANKLKIAKLNAIGGTV